MGGPGSESLSVARVHPLPQGGTQIVLPPGEGEPYPHCSVPTGTSMNMALSFSLEKCSHSCLHAAQPLPPCVLTGSRSLEPGVHE